MRGAQWRRYDILLGKVNERPTIIWLSLTKIRLHLLTINTDNIIGNEHLSRG